MTTRILRLPYCYPVLFEFNTQHFWSRGTRHKRSNPRIASASLVRLFAILPPGERQRFEGWRLWLYFRGNYALHFDLHIDKRVLYATRAFPSTLPCENCGDVG